jgi:S-DNA-T family DNA segregation ATPase FtsK/SpoIIIE
MATGKGKTPAKGKRSSESGSLAQVASAVGTLTLGTARTAASTQRRVRARGDIAFPAAGAVAGYLVSTVGGDPLGPLGPGWGGSGFDPTSPWQLTVGATVGAAALMHQRSPYAQAKREQRKIVKAFSSLGGFQAGLEEGPSLLYPKGRPIQVSLPTPTPAGSKAIVVIPDGSAEAVLQRVVPLLEPKLGKVTLRPVPPPPSAGQKVVQRATRALPSAARTAVADRDRVKKDMLAFKHLEINIRRREALGGEAPVWEHLREIRKPDFAGRSVWDPHHRGVDEDGNPVRLSIAQKNLLSGGEPGSGKTSTEHVDIAAAALDPTADIYLLDPSAAEFGFWEKVAAGSADSVEGCFDLLRYVHAMGNARLRSLAEAADEREAMGLPRANITRGERTTWVFIDELLYLTGNEDKKISIPFAAALADIVGRMRKVGFHVVCSTLKPTGDVIPTLLRDLITWKQAFRCTTPDASTAILGDKVWAQMGYGGHKIDKDGPVGVSYLLAQGGYPIRMRGVRLEGEDRLDVRDAALKVRGLPPIPRITAAYDPERAALLDPSRHSAVEAPRQREVITVAEPAVAIDPTPAPAPVAPARVSTRKAPTSASEPTSFADRLLAFITQHRQVSAAMLQREFGIDWDQAAQIIAALEEEGYLGPAEDGPMRKVLIEGTGTAPTPAPDEVDQARHGYDHRRKRRNRPRPSHRTDHPAPAGAAATREE